MYFFGISIIHYFDTMCRASLIIPAQKDEKTHEKKSRNYYSFKICAGMPCQPKEFKGGIKSM